MANNQTDSGYYNTNRFARIFLESLKEITGQHGLNTILNFSRTGFLIDNLPPDNLEKEFDFSYFSRINQALEDIYGSRGGRGLALRVGKTTFEDVLEGYGSLAGIGDAGFKILPIQEKISFGLAAMARIFSEISDQSSTVSEDQDSYRYRISRCPVCWGRSGEESPVCFYMIGLLQEGLCWVSGGKRFQVEESECLSTGDEHCEFVIGKQPID
jgi:predicted hydrocarbon binding protein